MLFQQLLGSPARQYHLDSIDWAETESPLENPNTAKVLRTAFLKDPLSQRPFGLLLSAISTTRSSLYTDRRALAEHVLRVAPRNAAARLTLVELYYRDGLYSETATNISKLIELDRENADLFLEVLAAMSAQSSSRHAVEEILSTQPDWGGQLISKMTSQSEDFDFLIKVSQNFPSSQSAVVGALVRAGDLEHAYAAFLHFLDEDTRNTPSVPFDGGFNDIAGPQPFNWRINRSFASFERYGGLSVSFFGQGHPLIADQIIRLSPGSYSAGFEMQGSLYRGGGMFAWSITCVKHDDVLLALPIETLPSVPASIEAKFTVPTANCDFQRLKLSGVAGEFPRTARATVTNVFIEPTDEVPAQ